MNTSGRSQSHEDVDVQNVGQQQDQGFLKARGFRVKIDADVDVGAMWLGNPL